MWAMFHGAESFNQSISDWDVSNVRDMGGMFMKATSFNQPLNGWDTSRVTNMWAMFHVAESFNQSISDWDVSNVRDMGGMFMKATSFNQPLNTSGNKWNVSSVTKMTDMFHGAESFNQPHMFHHLNAINLSYVVSRNHESHGNIDFMGHDIDFMVTDYNATVAALGALPSSLRATELGGGGVRHTVLIGGKAVDVDVRYVGDRYVDPNWMRDILRNRVLMNGIFFMEAEDYFYSLLYHVLIQKPQVGLAYKSLLMKMTTNSTVLSRLAGNRSDQCQLLIGFMKDRGYISPKSDDATVGFFPCSRTR